MLNQNSLSFAECEILGNGIDNKAKIFFQVNFEYLGENVD